MTQDMFNDLSGPYIKTKVLEEWEQEYRQHNHT